MYHKIALILILVLSSGAEARVGKTNTSEARTLSMTDTLGKWREAPAAERNRVCLEVAAELSDPQHQSKFFNPSEISKPSNLCKCISNSSSNLDWSHVDILFVADTCAVLLKADGLL